MEMTLAAVLRTDTGKGTARKLRASGKLPAVLYGPEHETVSLAVDPTDLLTIFRHTRDRNTVLQLQLDSGDTVPVMVRELQRHPVSRQPLHCDFYRVYPHRQVEAMVQVRPVGKAKGAELGGRVRIIRRDLRVRCTFDRIPATIDVDVTPLGVDEMVRASEIPTPDGVSLVFDRDFNVISVYGKKAEVETTDEDGEEV